MNKRPNLLLITTDQQRWDSFSLYGTPGYKTPVLDRLAKEGLCFTRTYTSSPICTPARVSLLTGQYPSRHGAFTIGTPHVPALDDPTVATRLGEAGYSTALIGKTHFVARFMEQTHIAGVKDVIGEMPEDFWRNFDGPYEGFDYIRHCAAHTNDRLPDGHYGVWMKDKGVEIEKYFRQGEDTLDCVSRIGAWDLDHELTQNAWIVEESVDWIEQQREQEKPWFCWASIQDPHAPYVCPEPYFSDVDMTGVETGGYIEGEFENKPPFYRHFMNGEYWRDDERKFFYEGTGVPHCTGYERNADPKTSIQAYIGMVNMIDDYMGKLVAYLEKTDQLDNTLIIFTSDHGDYLGRHGFWNKGIAPYDDCQRVPGIVHWPEGMKNRKERGVTDAFFSLVDIPWTLMDAAGLERPMGDQGVSQLPVIRGEAQAVREWALVELDPTWLVSQRTFLYGDYKMVVYRDADYGELYNMQDDPDQLTNLWDDPDAAAVKSSMMHRLNRANMERQGQFPPRISNA
ncbi:MAG: sulfatase [Candidatus Sumerlaeota bacterium]